MPRITEKRQILDFDSSWTAIKWDESGEFVGSMERALHQLNDGVKAADVIAVRDVRYRPKTLLLAEFKDYDHPNVPQQQQQQTALAAVSSNLMQNIVRKIIDTLSGVTFAHSSNDQRCDELASWRPALGQKSTLLIVLLCIEVPPSQSIVALAWTKELQRRLRWLGPNARVIVTNQNRPFQGDGFTYRVVSALT